jgi:hypothetical protein
MFSIFLFSVTVKLYHSCGGINLIEGTICLVSLGCLKYNGNMVSNSELIWKRKDERVILELLGDYRILEPYQHSVQTVSSIRNLGRGGVLLVSIDPVLVGTALQLRFYHHNNRFTVNSRVVWATAPGIKEPSGYQIGIKFEPAMQVSLLNIDFLLKNKT